MLVVRYLQELESNTLGRVHSHARSQRATDARLVASSESTAREVIASREWGCYELSVGLVATSLVAT